MTGQRIGTDAAAAQHATLRRMIIERELPPGTVLLETALSERLGVSRTHVREALARLAQEGLITRQTRGYVVDQLSPEEIIEVFDVRIVLECAAAERAAIEANDFELAHLEQLTEDHRLRIAGEPSTLTRALGVGERLDLDYRAVPVAPDDLFVFATDGVYEHVGTRAKGYKAFMPPAKFTKPYPNAEVRFETMRDVRKICGKDEPYGCQWGGLQP